ncbi:ribonuclease H-like domain-containing protein [Tanacetum coccineum]
MRMRQYICHTDHNLWDIIVNGDLEDKAAPSGEQSSPHVPKIAKQFGGNEESKKMQKNVLKHQFENFVTVSNETLDKAYDRFQKLISQPEIHGAYVSKEDINQKFLPPSWSQIALIIRNKPDIDGIDIDDLYNNLRVYKDDTNEVSTVNGDFKVIAAGEINQVPTTPSAYDIAYSFLAQPTTCSKIENEDFQQMDGDDLEELDLRWQVAMLTVRNNAQITESSSQALVAQDGLGGYDWSNDFEVEPVNYALMAISSTNSSSSSNSEVVKERDELKEKIAKWEDSSKNLGEILNNHMSARDKTSLGYSTKLNDLSSNHETDSENSFSVFDGRSSDEDSTPANDMSSQAEGETADQTNGEKPKSPSESVVSNPKINRNTIIIEDWHSDDEEEESEYKQLDLRLKQPVCTARPSVSTARLICTARPSISTARPVYASRPIYPRMDNVRPRGSCLPIKRTVVHTGKGKLNTELKRSKWVWRPKGEYLDHVSKDSRSFMLKKVEYVDPKGISTSDHAVVDSGCSSHMTGNKAYLLDYEDFNGGFVAFGSDPKGGKITGRGKIKTANLDFDDVYFVDELKFNLFSVSQMCDKKNSVLFTDTEFLILSLSFKLLDESQVVLRAPRKDDVHNLDLKNIVPSRGLTCLYANATTDESKLWHRRLGHVNFNNMNKLLKGNLVRGLPSKVFVNDHTYVACKKGKQHKASYKAKSERTIRKPLELLHMDLFGPVSIHSINMKRYCLVVTDDFSRFSWVFFLGKSPSISFMRPFGYPLTILNTLDSLGKFDGKSDEGYLLGYSTTRNGPNWMFDLDFHTNLMNYIPVSIENQVMVDADKDIQDLEDVFDKEGQHQMPEDEQVWQDELEMMVTQELVANAMNDESRQAFEEEKRRIASQKKAAQATSTNQLSTYRPFVSIDRSNTSNVSAASTSTGANADESSFVYLGGKIPIIASTLPNADLPIDPNMPDLKDVTDTLPNDGIFNRAYDDDENVGVVADLNNMDNTIAVSPIPKLRIYKDHQKGQILGDPTSAVQTRGKFQKASSAQQALVSYIHKQNRTNHKDHQNCLFACFLSPKEPKTITQALKDESWVEAMQEELL